MTDSRALAALQQSHLAEKIAFFQDAEHSGRIV
jgi:hypothetical protein